MFQKALRVGKKVRTETDIGQGKVSIASIVIDLASKIFVDLSSKTILLIGSGEMTRLMLSSLRSKSVRNILVASRNMIKAQNLVNAYGGSAILYDDIDSYIGNVDILIPSAGVSKFIISKKQISHWMQKRNGKTLFIVDLGVPRNVEHDSQAVKNVFLYNMNDLKTIASDNLCDRNKAVSDCKNIIREATALFMSKLASGDTYRIRFANSCACPR
jgi:glutamyl-tRNA reductase